MKKNEIDYYLDKVPNPQRKTLQAMRNTIQKILPAAKECISYGIPAFKIDEGVIGGIAAFKNHCSYFPFSSEVIDNLKSDLSQYEINKGTIRFSINKPLPNSIIKKLLQERLKLISKKIQLKTGVAKTFYDNGFLQSKGKITIGKMQGKWEWYRKNGSLMRTGEFNNGIQSGIWRTYKRDGSLVKETSFVPRKTSGTQ